MSILFKYRKNIEQNRHIEWVRERQRIDVEIMGLQGFNGKFKMDFRRIKNFPDLRLKGDQQFEMLKKKKKEQQCLQNSVRKPFPFDFKT